MALRDNIIGIALGLGLAIYILVGAAVFYACENPAEQANIQLGSATFSDFLNNFTCVTTKDLVALLTTARTLSDAGVRMGNTTSEATVWTYASSVFFSGTIVTTIGYGSMTPTTTAAQIFCCFYAIFGIPLCLVLLAKIGASIAKINKGFVNKLVKWPEADKRRSTLALVLLSVNGTILLILIPCISFSYVEGWSYGTSLYFSVITLSTVGFGDYTLEDNRTGALMLYRIVNFLWVIFGLSWFASILSTIQDSMTEKVDHVTDKKTSENTDKIGDALPPADA